MRINGLGYRELEVLGRELTKLGMTGSLDGVALGTELEIEYNPHADMLTMTDGNEYVEIDVASYNENNKE